MVLDSGFKCDLPHATRRKEKVRAASGDPIALSTVKYIKSEKRQINPASLNCAYLISQLKQKERSIKS